MLSAESLTVRTVDPAQLAAAPAGTDAPLYRVEWQARAEAAGGVRPGPDLVLVPGGGSGGGLAQALAVPAVSSIAAVAEREPRPAHVVLDLAQPGPVSLADPVAGVHAAAEEMLLLLQAWLAEDRLAESHLSVVTRGAVAVGDEESVVNLVHAPVWGLVRSAQNEHPGRFTLIDLEPDEITNTAPAPVLAALTSGADAELAVRSGTVRTPRLVRGALVGGGLLVPPLGGGGWRLDVTSAGTLEHLALVPVGGVGPGCGLESGQVRVAVRVAGLNFRDVLLALGMYPGRAVLGSEGAGVVVEVAEDVVGVRPGDRVMGLFAGGVGPFAVADERLLVPVPEGWSFAQAATTPIVFLTALYALGDLAGVRPGERVLVHAAAGGVGMAAVQIAGVLGASCWATAHPDKWPVVRGMGVPAERVASSRTLEFEQRFSRDSSNAGDGDSGSAGGGVDVVLNSLTQEFVDASLRLRGSGGRFIERGRAAVRDAGVVGAEHPGVEYRAFDLMEAGPERLGVLLRRLVGWFAEGVLEPLPVVVWPVFRAAEAFRHLAQARHVGKVALSVPAASDPVGTTLITGATGVLAGRLAVHLAESGVSRHLLLATRQDPEAIDGDGELGALAGRWRSWVLRCGGCGVIPRTRYGCVRWWRGSTVGIR